jgi:hypothetical protein
LGAAGTLRVAHPTPLKNNVTTVKQPAICRAWYAVGHPNISESLEPLRTDAMEPFMASKEKAELHFKRKQELANGQAAKSEYEQHARGEREQMAKLRALRLARDANVSANQTNRPQDD